MDRRLQRLFAATMSRHREAAGRSALVAVGGYGRGELSPYSDIDVVLVHEPSLRPDTVAALAEALWYPLWDDGVPLDHAVRDTVTMRDLAASDLRAATGILDARHVAGDRDLAVAMRSTVLTDWRSSARTRLPELLAAGEARAALVGDLAHAAVPDLKEARGGLRDGAVLRALVATWLVDVPHRAAESYRSGLLDVRDALHAASGRRGNRLQPELLADVAAALGTTPDDLDREVRDLGRRTAHLLQLTWRRVRQVLSGPGPARSGGRRPELVPLAAGVAAAGGEVVLDRQARVAEDAELGLRAAAAAATAGLLLAPATAARLAAEAPPLPEPWEGPARRTLVRLLASGPGLRPVWEELDQTGVVDALLPEWEPIRLRPSRSALHRFTVDRHLVETCVEATRLLPQVSRPDLLVVAALLHDIGKHDPGGADHSVVGADLARRIAVRWGFDEPDADTVAFLVRHHLLLPRTAVHRDVDDPDTLAGVAAVVGDQDRLDLLAALSESDARAAAPAAWTSWRAGLVHRLVDALRVTLATGRPSAGTGRPLADDAERPPPDWALELRLDEVRLTVAEHDDGCTVQVAARDRIGLLADVAAALTTAGLPVRAARAAVHGGTAVSSWELDANHVDASRVRMRLDRVLAGTAPEVPAVAGSARVLLLPAVTASATVLEVRAADRAGLVWRLCRCLADLDVDVRSAHLETLGPQAEDVVYVTDRSGRPLDPERAEQVRQGVEDALTGPT